MDIKEKVIENVNIVNYNSIIFGNIYIKNNKIEKIKILSTREKTGFNYCIPAFIDQHTHGGYGISFDNFSELKKANLSEYFINIPKEGVCKVVPTTVTNKFSNLKKIANFMSQINSEIVGGWHIEGPYISKIKKGAHNQDYIKKVSLKEIEEIKLLYKNKKILTIAPEQLDNINDIKKIADKNTFISIGHTMADYDMAKKSYEYGAIQVTHLFNAMKEFSYREPSVVNYVLGNKKNAELIADGVHVNNYVINDTYNEMGSDNIILISDSLSPKGLKDGSYMLGDLPIFKLKNHCYLENKTTLSGSAMKYIDIVKNFLKATKCSMQDIVKVSSYNTAKNLSLKGYGLIKEKIKCNLLIVDDKLNIIENLITNK